MGFLILALVAASILGVGVALGYWWGRQDGYNDGIKRAHELHLAIHRDRPPGLVIVRGIDLEDDGAAS